MEKKTFSCCFTGYRPQKFPFPLEGSNPAYTEFENRLITAVLELAKEGCRTFYSGMAMGFDIIAAECVLLAAELNDFRDVKLVCALPFKEQAASFPPPWKSRYDEILSRADEIILISDKYYRNCYFDRNRFLVDNSDCVLTWYDGSAGGTKNTLGYAKSIGRKIINLNTEYENDRSDNC